MKICFGVLLVLIWFISGCAQLINDNPKDISESPKKEGSGPVITASVTAPSFGSIPVLTSGVSASGNIASAGGDTWYKFSVGRSSIVSIETTLGTLADSYMEIYWSFNSMILIDYNDDGGVGLASKIERPFAYMGTKDDISGGGYIYVRIRGYSTSQTGTFTIKITDKTSEVRVIKSDGTHISGDISVPGKSDWYQYDVTSTGYNYFQTSLATLPDSYINYYVLGDYSIYNLTAKDDDSGGGLSSRMVVTNGKLSYSNPCYLQVRAYSKSQSGTYQVWCAPATMPSVTAFYILDSTPVQIARVYLRADASGSATEYIASESSSFSGASWKPFVNNFFFDLSPANGTKTIYYKVRNQNGESSVTSTTVTMSDPRPSLTLNGGWVSGTASSSSSKEYRLVVSQGGLYRVETSSSSMDYSLQVCGPNTSSLYFWSTRYQNCKTSPYIEGYFVPGVYYIKVSTLSGSASSYSIRALNTSAQTVGLALSSTGTSASIGVLGECDWYCVNVPYSGTYTLEGTPGTLNRFGISLFSSVYSLDTWLSPVRLPVVDSTVSRSVTLSAGTYYILVSGDSMDYLYPSGTGSYSFRIW